jgi:hypothetical protein
VAGSSRRGVKPQIGGIGIAVPAPVPRLLKVESDELGAFSFLNTRPDFIIVAVVAHPSRRRKIGAKTKTLLPAGTKS